MNVSARMRSDYPTLAHDIYLILGKVPGKKKVFDAFVKYSELDQATARGLLTTCSLKPTIDYDAMPGSNGQFRGGTDPDKVFLAKEICERYKNNPKERKDPRMLVLLESTILHELVHWGDWKDGKDQAGEEGKAFEKAAYGKDINRYF